MARTVFSEVAKRKQVAAASRKPVTGRKMVVAASREEVVVVSREEVAVVSRVEVVGAGREDMVGENKDSEWLPPKKIRKGKPVKEIVDIVRRERVERVREKVDLFQFPVSHKLGSTAVLNHQKRGIDKLKQRRSREESGDDEKKKLKDELKEKEKEKRKSDKDHAKQLKKKVQVIDKLKAALQKRKKST